MRASSNAGVIEEGENLSSAGGKLKAGAYRPTIDDFLRKFDAAEAALFSAEAAILARKRQAVYRSDNEQMAL